MNYLFSPTRIYFQAKAIARWTKKFTTNLDQNKETKLKFHLYEKQTLSTIQLFQNSLLDFLENF